MRLPRLFKKIDHVLDTEVPLLILLLLVLVLRLPTLFEPYWYGDEGIYLTIGNALRHGEILYQDIVDHKTPLIYYLAMVPSQAWFRVLTTGFMLVATATWYQITLKMTKSVLGSLIGGLVFVLGTSLPLMEGNIPNGELFVMSFILVGGWLLTHTKLWNKVVAEQSNINVSQHDHEVLARIHDRFTKINDWVLLIASGIFFGLAVLTKVPGVFDVAGWLSIAWFVAIKEWPHPITSKKLQSWLTTSLATVGPWIGIISAGLIGSIILSILYYMLRGAGADYLDFGLLYNFKYVQNWVVDVSNPIIVWLLTLPGKITVIALTVLVLSGFRQWLRVGFQFTATWFVGALVAATLSNRPYPHYYLQIIPPLALLVGTVVASMQKIWIYHGRRQFSQERQIIPKAFTEIGVAIVLLLSVWGTTQVLGFWQYPVIEYYQRSWQYATNQITTDEYRQQFDTLMADNYRASSLIEQVDRPKLFIWGTNPMLYAMTDSFPEGRFTVAFHIEDLGLYEETLASVEEDLPHFIVVMYNQGTELPGLNELLQNQYILHEGFDNFELWKKQGNAL